MFGPLVIARSVFALEDGWSDLEPPCLWQAMSKAICRKTSDKKRRIAVNDSKQLYTPARGLHHLERGVLSFAALAGLESQRLDELLHAVAYDAPSRQPDQLWYSDDTGGPLLPSTIDSGQLTISKGQLRRAAEAGGVQMDHLNAAVIYEDRFNHMVAATRSKASCTWTFVAGHLLAIWKAHGERDPLVVIDRQGGRQHYRDQLAMVFEGAEVDVLGETPLSSDYQIIDGDRRMTVLVQTGSEERHLPVALASMTAKYLRELLMSRFNAFWLSHQPQTAPTAGYAKDGKRFLADIEPLIVKLGIDRSELIRAR